MTRNRKSYLIMTLYPLYALPTNFPTTEKKNKEKIVSFTGLANHLVFPQLKNHGHTETPKPNDSPNINLDIIRGSVFSFCLAGHGRWLYVYLHHEQQVRV